MKTTVFATCLLAALSPIVSGWRLRLYSEEQYQGEFLDRSGSTGTGCTNLASKYKNKAMSMKWDSDVWYGDCDVYLYNRDGCVEELARSIGGGWDVPRFSTNAARKINSYRVDC
jgi:hypothetical protein